MSIVRVRRQSSFTVIPNEIINDDALDGATLGLLVYLLSKPKDWCISIKSIAGLKRFGSHGKVVEGLKLLRALGYAQLQKFRDGSTDWIITDEKGRFDPDSENRNKAHQPDSENRNKANQGNDTPGTPDLMPDSENRNKAGTPDLMPDSENRNALKRTEENKKLKMGRNTKNPALELLLSAGVEPQIAEDFLMVRKDKRAKTFTTTAFEGLAREARKAGLSVNEAVRVCAEASWTSFTAKWYANRIGQASTAPPTRQFPAEQKSRAREFLA